MQCYEIQRLQFPHWLRQALTTLEHSRSLLRNSRVAELPADSIAQAQSSNPAKAFEGHGYFPCGLRVGLDANVNAIAVDRYLVQQNPTNRKF